ncbi:MAG: hypothetical protein JST59_02190 [Actinobacteria bacterium]|nr:hypothetical protein [Actinomycetota bacterium]
MWFGWVAPGLILVVWGLVLGIKVRRETKAETNQQQLYKKVSHIPILSFVLLFFNLLTKILTNTIEGFGQKGFSVFVILNMMFYAVPVANLVLFVLYTREDNVRLAYFEFLMCRRNNDGLLANSFF